MIGGLNNNLTRGRMDMNYNLLLTKEEVDALLTQINGRIDSLKALQKEEAKNGRVERVLEIEKFIQPILTGRDKLINASVNVQ